MQQRLRRPPLGRRLRLGFVGGGRTGQVGAWHAAGARLSAHWDIVAGALSTDPEVAILSARDLGLAEGRGYPNYRAMAAAEASRVDGIEAVAICTPNWTHVPIAAEFLRRGVDVILDKPATWSSLGHQHHSEMTGCATALLHQADLLDADRFFSDVPRAVMSVGALDRIDWIVISGST
jgi:hypothetical protein